MERHVADLCRISYYHLRELRRLCRYLNHETAVRVANALVSSRLDYCSSLLYNTKKAYTSRLQRVQNALCRTVCKRNKNCHVTPLLHKLHWLPIHYRILFKYNLLTYKAIHFSQPPYLSSLIRWSDLARGNHLSISSSKPNKHSGLRSFIIGAPTEWNKLPRAIRTIESISGFRKQFIYLFGVSHRFQHCTGHITTGSWKGRGNHYIQFIRVLYCKLPTNGKQLPAFPLEAVPRIEPRPPRSENS